MRSMNESDNTSCVVLSHEKTYSGERERTSVRLEITFGVSLILCKAPHSLLPRLFRTCGTVSAPPSRRVRRRQEERGERERAPRCREAGAGADVRRRLPACEPPRTTTAPRQGGGPSRLRRPPPRHRPRAECVQTWTRKAE